MHGAWVRFVKTGDPGWRPYDCEQRPVMAFDAPESRVVNDPHAEMRDLLAAT
jgi:para-nitrobenzyl esterase